MDLQNAALFRLIFENALHGVVLVDEQLCCLDANPAFCMMVGRSRDSILRSSCKTLVSAADVPSLDLAARRLWQNGSWQGELRMPAADGSTRTVEWKISTQENDTIAMAVLTDVSARRRYEESLTEAKDTARRRQLEAENANRSKDYFLGVVSHEMRTPIAAVLGATRVLQQKLSADAEAMKFLAIIERQTNLQVRTIEDLLDLTRIAAGIMKLELWATDLCSVVGTAVETMSPACETKEVALEWKPPENPLTVLADSGRLQQIVLNLLVNAVKFTPPRGAIKVTLAEAGGRAQLMIRDTGVGIDPDLISDIFTPFVQGQGNSGKGGLGLGLPIVKHLVELHGGRIEIHSDGKGRGTIVVIEIPLALSSEPDENLCMQRGT